MVKASPYFALSIDEKDRFLIVVLSYFAKGARVTVPIAYRDLAGFDASDLFSLAQSILESWGLDKQFLIGFTADGASVMGTRASIAGRGQNVAAKLSEWAGHPLLITHCAPQKKLQLCVVDAWKDPYLKDLEKQIKALLKDSPPSVLEQYRQATTSHYKKGRLLVKRKRAKRSDTGKARPKYTARKKHSGLRGLPNARLLSREPPGEVAMDDAPADLEEHSFWKQMSPRKKNKK
eukprot:s35_g17.t1